MKIIKAAKIRNITGTNKLKREVSLIIDDVRLRGDDALAFYSEKFDLSKRRTFRIGQTEIDDALKTVPALELKAMKLALKNIRAFAKAQRAGIGNTLTFEPSPGLLLGHRITPVDSVCCYVPGGAYPLFSSAMMLVTPAKVAGVPRIAATTPVMKGTNAVNPKTLAALALAGADEIYAAGGVQAVAAFAYGTKQIKNVDLIVGPGNSYVAEAKRQCYGQVGIDFIAGPSEVLVIADDSADPAIVAGDLLAQCEHDKMAQAILVTDSEQFARQTLSELEHQLIGLSTAALAASSWKNYGEILIAESIDEAASYANERAPEHLELQTKHNTRLEKKLRNYGALFIGENAAEVFGDYAAGTNHTLPTMRAARYTGGLWVGTFLKTLTFQKTSREAASKLARTTSLLARAEGLAAHSAAAERRK
jgi:histidinol dehydrogenase